MLISCRKSSPHRFSISRVVSTSFGSPGSYGVNNGGLRPRIIDREYGVGRSILDDGICNQLAMGVGAALGL